MFVLVYFDFSGGEIYFFVESYGWVGVELGKCGLDSGREVAGVGGFVFL